MAFSFDSLPNECLIVILTKFSLLDQIRLRIISKQWNSILLSMIAKRKALKLFPSYQYAEDYCRELAFLNLHEYEHLKLKPIGQLDDDLVVESDRFDSAVCNQLKTLFPDIEHLSIYLSKEPKPYISNLSNLTSNWTLKNLTLLGYVKPKDVPYFRTQLGQFIGRLKSLERLDLFLKHKAARNYNWDPTEARPFYNRLQICALDELISPLIGRISSPNFVELNLNWTSNLSLDKIRQSIKSRKFSTASSMTHLRLSAIEDPYLPTLVSSFPSLHSLDLEFSNWPMLSSLIPEFARLPNLETLRLAFLQIDKLSTLPDKLLSIPSCDTIKSLSLCEAGRFDGNARGFYEYSPIGFNGDEFCATVAQCFPKLESLTIRANSCYEKILHERIEKNLQLYFGSNLKQFRFCAKVDYQNMFGKEREDKLMTRDSILGFYNSIDSFW